MADPKIALVLSGGGARGAYEAGVLCYLLEKLPGVIGRPVRFHILCGTSVGAIHACYLAATASEGEGSGRRLAEIWQSLSLGRVYRLGPKEVLDFIRRLTGIYPPKTPDQDKRLPPRLNGLLNTRPLEDMVLTQIPWQKIPQNLRHGYLDALCVSATAIATGKTVVFIQHGRSQLSPWARDPFVVARPARIGPAHALASAALPLIFPAVRIGREFYCDGGLRQNTPLSPALRLGAERVIVVGLHSQPPAEEEAHLQRQRVEAYGNPAFLFGKVLNALLLDRVDYDVDRMRLFNAVLEGGEKSFGPEFYDRINAIITPVRGAPYRKVQDCFIRPSEDIGAIAARYARKMRKTLRLSTLMANAVISMVVRGAAEDEADLLSYLLFDGDYATELVRLGVADAEAARPKLIELFSQG